MKPLSARAVVVLAALTTFSLLAAAHSALAQAPPPPAPGSPIPVPGLTADQAARYQAGLRVFLERFTPQTGLGPVFNDDACSRCHAAPVAGGSSGRLVTRFGTLKSDGNFDALERLGGSLVQERSLVPVPGCSIPPEIVPREATIVARRRTQPLFGLGFVDAVPDATFETLARNQAFASPSTAGRVNHVSDVSTGQVRVGRFGWKAQVPTLRQFSGDALLNEQGITNPLFPSESCPQGNCALLACNPAPALNDNGTRVTQLADFQTMLGAPLRGPITQQVLAGQTVFNNLRCGSCHAQSLRTGASPVTALNNVTFSAWSDFLLHDMGRLGDGVTQGEATGRWMRTSPLWGVSQQPRWLHDGRAATLEDAITQHDGQGAAARDGFTRLSATDRSNLVAFLRSL